MEKLKHISIRIDGKTLKNLHYVAKYNGRSANGQIISLINKSVREFEEKHGEIEFSDSEE